jgi:hypothetical protein
MKAEIIAHKLCLDLIVLLLLLTVASRLDMAFLIYNF